METFANLLSTDGRKITTRSLFDVTKAFSLNNVHKLCFAVVEMYLFIKLTMLALYLELPFFDDYSNKDASKHDPLAM